jgi:hypothetical protein
VKYGRYEIRKTSRRKDARWGIWDRWLHGWCTLPIGWPDRIESLEPLVWDSYERAHHWIQSCRMAWLFGKAPMPDGAGAVRRERARLNERGDKVMIRVYE